MVELFVMNWNVLNWSNTKAAYILKPEKSIFVDIYRIW